MSYLSKILAVCLGILIANCSPVYQISYDYDRTADFTSPKTYSWLPLQAKDQTDELLHKRIKHTVNNELESKGYKMVSDNPDFLILAKIGTKKEWWHGGGGHGYGGRGYHYGGSYSTQIEAGTLLLDFVDAKSKNLIWRGKASAVLDYNLSPEKLDKLVDEVVRKIFEEFPPKPSK